MLPFSDSQTLADRLAEMLCSDSGLRTFRLMAYLRHGSDTTASAVPGTAEAVAQNQVGIWRRKADDINAPFLRQAAGSARHMWADITEIPPKGAKKRIAFIGESVARGFFYAPHVSPASLLEALLTNPVDGGCEVIDLARTDMQPDALVNLAPAATALQPDAIIVFAGNNWHPVSMLQRAHFHELASLVENSNSWSEVNGYLRSCLASRVQTVLAALGNIVRTRGIPVTFIIPEFNLEDWTSRSVAPPLLDGNDLVHWMTLCEQAENALTSGEPKAAAELARLMLKVDGGTSPAAYYILASAMELTADGSHERRLMLEAARDATLSQGKYHPPRCFGLIQEILRKESKTQSIATVDLPRVFEKYLEGGIPGRRLFHDYCHLTFEGMSVAMAATARGILQSFDIPERSDQPPFPAFKAPEKVEAQAHFLAAIHNANWGNKLEVISYHLNQAISLHPPICNWMKLFLDFHIRTSPVSVCAAFEELANSAGLAVVALLFRSPRVQKTINFDLVEAILQVLAVREPDAHVNILDLIKKEHGIARGKRNLLQTPYLRPPEAGDQRNCAYYHANARRSQFIFIVDRQEDALGKITLRTGREATPGEAQIYVNNVLAASVIANRKWRSHSFVLQSHLLHEGMNLLEIMWPPFSFSSADRVRHIVRALEDGKIPELSPVCGEIFTLTLESAHGVSPN